MAGLAAPCMTIPGCSRAGKSDSTAMRYVVPAPGNDMEHAAFRALPLSEMKPAELKETAAVSRQDAALCRVPLRLARLNACSGRIG